MSVLSHLALTVCYISVAVTIISLFLPQKRTRRIFGFVIGLFVTASLIAAVKGISLQIGDSDLGEIAVPETSVEDLNEAVKQKTAENLVAATDELLRSEDIEAKDIRLRLKITDEGRIFVEDVVIYISEDDFFKKQKVEQIVYGNLSKEPRVYVEKEVQRAGEE